jgi:hypothetical protein
MKCWQTSEHSHYVGSLNVGICSLTQNLCVKHNAPDKWMDFVVNTYIYQLQALQIIRLEKNSVDMDSDWGRFDGGYKYF